MYTYSGSEKEIVRSLIEQYPPVSPDDLTAFIFIMMVRDFKNPEAAAALYRRLL